MYRCSLCQSVQDNSKECKHCNSKLLPSEKMTPQEIVNYNKNKKAFKTFIDNTLLEIKKSNFKSIKGGK